MQPSIGDYALIGDGRTAALSSSAGSIDWMCLPRFDSDPIFGRLLSEDGGGSFSIAPIGVTGTTRRYRSGSAVLETTWRTRSAELLLTEGLVLDASERLGPQLLLCRRLKARGGSADVEITFDPRNGFTGERLRVGRRGDALVCTRGSLAVSLQSSPVLAVTPGEALRTTVSPDTPLTIVFAGADREPLVFVEPAEALRRLEATDRWWREWSGRISYQGARSEAVVRSLITLRLLTYAPSGAPVAAPTTSLPEVIGGDRNWDYRYAWPRDASIGVEAFLELGRDEEARSFMHWLLHSSRLTHPRLRVLYTLDGKPGPEERELDEIGGFRRSAPVRVGNAAGDQHQLDVYGWVLEAAWHKDRVGDPLQGAEWRAIAGFVDLVAERWREPDAGIWEVRGPPTHHVHSKLMAWRALDRACRLADRYRTRPRRAQTWRNEREALANDLRTRGFDDSLGSYVGRYGSRDLDAAVLFVATTAFDRDPARVNGTVDAVRRELSAGGPLLYRYEPESDGQSGREGAFLPCSFWLAQALAATGRNDEAEALFDTMCDRANDVGLFAEEMDPSTGEHLGNFPQALTHASLIQAALALQRVSED
ncbi:MAG TPA: glycoside hydrolase family 15 protein [Actinomycetota bacterium]|nr:glycoside hydrolase family 15 protein [Actinomycetota bacterium]